MCRVWSGAHATVGTPRVTQRTVQRVAPVGWRRFVVASGPSSGMDDDFAGVRTFELALDFELLFSLTLDSLAAGLCTVRNEHDVD